MAAGAYQRLFFGKQAAFPGGVPDPAQGPANDPYLQPDRFCSRGRHPAVPAEPDRHGDRLRGNARILLCRHHHRRGELPENDLGV